MITNPAQLRKRAKEYLSQPFPVLDYSGWQPKIGDREDERKLRYDFVPHNTEFIHAYWRAHLQEMAGGGRRAASIRMVDVARKVVIRDKDGVPLQGKNGHPHVDNGFSPMFARLMKRVFTDLPIGLS